MGAGIDRAQLDPLPHPAPQSVDAEREQFRHWESKASAQQRPAISRSQKMDRNSSCDTDSYGEGSPDLSDVFGIASRTGRRKHGASNQVCNFPVPSTIRSGRNGKSG